MTRGIGSPTLYQFLADAVLVLHFGVVVFVVGGLAAVWVGHLAGWGWIHRRSFRVAHLLAIGFVVVQAWLGRVCPLTTLESWLRVQAGTPAYRAGFVAHWVERLLFYEASPWVFALAYTLFGVLVLASWWYVPPRRRPHREGTGGP